MSIVPPISLLPHCTLLRDPLPTVVCEKRDIAVCRFPVYYLLWIEKGMVAAEVEGNWCCFEVDAEKRVAAAEGASSDGADQRGGEATIE